MGNLSAKEVESIKAGKKATRYSDGDTLTLLVKPGKNGPLKYWYQRITIDGKREDKRIGKYPRMSLKEARKTASKNRWKVDEGINPWANDGKPKVLVPTFRELAEEAINHKYKTKWGESGRDKTRSKWEGRLEIYAYPKIGDMPVDQIRHEHILKIIKPISSKLNPTARDVNDYINAVMVWGVASNYINKNPIKRDAIKVILGKREEPDGREKMPYERLGEAIRLMDSLKSPEIQKLCFKFLILCASRSEEARGALWSEIDLERGIWVIPKTRMKNKKEHRVPLSDEAFDILKRAEGYTDQTDHVFPSTYTAGGIIAHNTLTRILDRVKAKMKPKPIGSVHGMRGSFGEWTLDFEKNHLTAKIAISHYPKGEQAPYFGRDAMRARRSLMQEWASYLNIV